MHFRSNSVTTLLTLALFFPLWGFSLSIESASNGENDFSITLKIENEDLSFTKVHVGPQTFTRLLVPDSGLNLEYVGQPDIPRFHRWLAISSNLDYSVEYTASDVVVLNEVLLYPTQPDPIDDGRALPFAIEKNLYEKDTWIGVEAATAGPIAELGDHSILPVTLQPVQYNPGRKQLKIFKNLTVQVKSRQFLGKPKPRTSRRLNSFSQEQLSLLTLNGNDYLKKQGAQSALDIYLILSDAQMMPYAKQIGSYYADKTANAYYAEVLSGITSTQLKALIKEHQTRLNLSHVLLFGDAKRIPPYKFSNGYLGDAYYSFVNGTDEIADLALGRLPVADSNDATLIVAKMRKYRELQGQGFINKKTLLIAHREGYPGKYTANMESVKNSPNPLELEYVTQYGGVNATSQSVVDEAQNRYAIINYRGHGSRYSWSSWGKDGSSFGFSHVDQLPEIDTSLSFIFNVACDNGAFQGSQVSLAQKELFPSKDPVTFKGAIAALGATAASSTEVNHRFNANLFQYLQMSKNTEIGNVYALANNKLVQDNGSSPVSNVRMYVLFADPMLSPWIR